MADLRADHEIVTNFLLDTCHLCQCINNDSVGALIHCVSLGTGRISSDPDEPTFIPVITGSVAEFYIQPMLSCVGDLDIMFYFSNELAIPAGTAPPTQLSDEFDSGVWVFEIVDSEFPGYVYLMCSYFLKECIDDGKYNAVECKRRYLTYKIDDKSHGPSVAYEWLRTTTRPTLPMLDGHVARSRYAGDDVYCYRCLSWPSQAADWPTRHRNYGWPDSATVDHVVSNGCDVVRVAHRQCRQHEWMRHRQHRLSFSRAEVVLLNSWIPVQQIVYHMLRVFVKTERLTDSANNSVAATLSNYHIKTLMLWACELKPRSWWIDDLNVVRLSVELLHTLGVWLTDARCQHYFIHNCNLFDHPDNWDCSPLLIASRLMSETEASLAEWFINSYIRKCAQFCPDDVSRLFDDVTNRTKYRTRFQRSCRPTGG